MINYREILENLVNDANTFGEILDIKNSLEVRFEFISGNPDDYPLYIHKNRIELFNKARLTLYKGYFKEFISEFTFSNNYDIPLTKERIDDKFNDLAKECLIHLLLVKSELQSKIESGEISLYDKKEIKTTYI